MNINEESLFFALLVNPGVIWNRVFEIWEIEISIFPNSDIIYSSQFLIARIICRLIAVMVHIYFK